MKSWKDRAFLAEEEQKYIREVYLLEVQIKYNELLNAVKHKYKGEDLHQTALRYIKERESLSECVSLPGLSKETKNGN